MAAGRRCKQEGNQREPRCYCRSPTRGDDQGGQTQTPALRTVGVHHHLCTRRSRQPRKDQSWHGEIRSEQHRLTDQRDRQQLDIAEQ